MDDDGDHSDDDGDDESLMMVILEICLVGRALGVTVTGAF